MSLDVSAENQTALLLPTCKRDGEWMQEEIQSYKYAKYPGFSPKTWFAVRSYFEVAWPFSYIQ